MQLQVFSKMGTLSLTICGFNNYIFEQKPFLKNVILDSITNFITIISSIFFKLCWNIIK